MLRTVPHQNGSEKHNFRRRKKTDQDFVIEPFRHISALAKFSSISCGILYVFCSRRRFSSRNARSSSMQFASPQPKHGGPDREVSQDRRSRQLRGIRNCADQSSTGAVAFCPPNTFRLLQKIVDSEPTDITQNETILSICWVCSLSTQGTPHNDARVYTLVHAKGNKAPVKH